jgi:hypothetical protein
LGLDAWTGHFLAALVAEAEDGLALLDRQWPAPRAAVAGRRRYSHAAAAVDILAAAPSSPPPRSEKRSGW